MSLLASLLMAGCSQEDIAPDEGANGNGEANTSYMAVNLVSSDATGSRATGGVYEDGSDIENSVKKVRFYFFNGVGGPVNVKTTASGTPVNYYDWENPTSESGNQEGRRSSRENRCRAESYKRYIDPRFNGYFNSERAIR